MVNITDTFTKMYGRPPTPRELGTLMKMHANPDYVRELLQRETEPAKKPAPKPEGVQCNIRAWATNCLMQDGYTIEQVAHILCVTVEQIEYNIKRHKLPRNDLIPPKK